MPWLLRPWHSLDNWLRGAHRQHECFIAEKNLLSLLEIESCMTIRPRSITTVPAKILPQKLFILGWQFSSHRGSCTSRMLRNLSTALTILEDFHICTMHLAIIKVLFLPNDVQENRFERSINIYIKNAPTCFGAITIIMGAYCVSLLKLVLKQLIKIHHCG